MSIAHYAHVPFCRWISGSKQRFGCLVRHKSYLKVWGSYTSFKIICVEVINRRCETSSSNFWINALFDSSIIIWYILSLSKDVSMMFHSFLTERKMISSKVVSTTSVGTHTWEITHWQLPSQRCVIMYDPRTNLIEGTSASACTHWC